MYQPEMPAYGAESYAYPAANTAVYPADVDAGSTSASTNFKKLNCCACFCAVAIFAVLIAAASTNWYKYNETWQGTPVDTTGTAAPQTVTLNYTRRYYDLQGVTHKIKPDNMVEDTKTFTYSSDASDLFAVFKLSQAFVLVGLLFSGLLTFFLVLCFADAVRNKLLFVAGMNVLRIVLLLIGIIILVSLCIAFLGFLGITDAFSNEIPSCQLGYCRRFSDNTQDSYSGMDVVVVAMSTTPIKMTVTKDIEWGPDAGWYCTLACIPIAILLVILVVLNKFPIPVDSVGSGEAL